MSRVEHIGNATLYLGDCRDVLPMLQTAHAVVTDPPYGVNYAEWDRDIPEQTWLSHARRIARVTLFTPGNGSQYRYPPPDWTLAWARPGSVQRAAGGGFSHWEPILVYGRNPMPFDCKIFAADTGAGDVDHPCPKPVKVMRWLVAEATEPGETVVDPFMGSGTTGIACAQLGRRFIGIEIEPKYFEIALRRIEEAQRQGDLLRDVLPKVEQKAFDL